MKIAPTFAILGVALSGLTAVLATKKTAIRSPAAKKEVSRLSVISCSNNICGELCVSELTLRSMVSGGVA
jgi:hypothetical protein